VAEGVGDLEGFQFGDAAARFLPEEFEIGGVDFVLALDLLDHQLGVGDDSEAGMVVVEGVLETGEQAGVFCVVVGADAEEFAKFCKDGALVVLDEGTEAGGTGIAAGSSVAVGVDPGGFGGGLGGGSVGEEAWGGTGRHGVSVTRSW
jgi:hypothetical protein